MRELKLNEVAHVAGGVAPLVVVAVVAAKTAAVVAAAIWAAKANEDVSLFGNFSMTWDLPQ